MPTIKDVARTSGVSVATVSNYLNNRSVREENEQAIKEAIQKLDYRVDTFARSFRTKKTCTVGVVVNTFYSLFYMELLHEMEKYFKTNGYCMIVYCSDNNCDIEREIVQNLIDKYVDAIILFPVSYKNSRIDDLVQDKIPVILVDRVIKNTLYPSVTADNISASYHATEYLIQNGHTNIALITGHMDASTANERVTGFCQALTDYGIADTQNNIFTGDYTKDSGYASAKAALERSFSALYVLSLDLLLGVMDALRDSHVNVPNDISLVTFDHSEYLDLAENKITVIRQPNREIGIEAAKRALESIAGKDECQPLIRLRCELIIRDSVAQNRMKTIG